MTLTETFNKGKYVFERSDIATLNVRADEVYYRFDFALRIMTVFASGPSTVPFSALDRDTLVELRDRLVKLGGDPPELPPEAQVGPQKPRALNP